MIKPCFNNSWDSVLASEFKEQYFQILMRFIDRERQDTDIYPPEDDVFNAFRLTSYDDVKVVILGQDPYHGPGQAHGLAFSVQDGVKPPPSLVNIYKELNKNLGVEIPEHGNLTPWAENGVFLLNTSLTVRRGEPGSHARRGWPKFTDKVIEILAQRDKKTVFLLWGKHACDKAEIINKYGNDKHLIVRSAHPSPFSAYKGFFGTAPFGRANEFLREDAVDWKL